MRFTNCELTEFEGRYHHWDSYPSGLGATLWNLYHGHFQKDLNQMLQVLIDEHPAGWSTINNKDFAKDPGFEDPYKLPCVNCFKAHWEHYYQSWESNGRRLTSVARYQMSTGNYLALDHPFQKVEGMTGPECYCHGGRSEEGWLLTHQDAAGSGCEYIYGFDEGPTLVIFSSYHPDGDKMIGMFGMGDPGSVWKEIARIPLDGPEPDWENIGPKEEPDAS